MASAHDKAVLNVIFNPLMPVENAAVSEDFVDQKQSESCQDESADEKRAKELEIQGVRAAEAGNVDEALKLFNDAIAVSPSRPSCYNNRAQAFRLKFDTAGAKRDLEKAIELSNHEGKAACQAYTQRALIHRLEGDDCAAKSDFEAASKLGSEFAKMQLVMMNPYAAMCNKMLSEVMGRLRRGEPEDQVDESHPPA